MPFGWVVKSYFHARLRSWVLKVGVCSGLNPESECAEPLLGISLEHEKTFSPSSSNMHTDEYALPAQTVQQEFRGLWRLRKVRRVVPANQLCHCPSELTSVLKAG
ncbi:hypothetical protein R3I93_006034 [Phoxinus phoxinus]|uniref:Uncharacterized protein n=1 Tax=Phoxinus phoxinus TaxID=58324 RepID=A0AAN9D822_9TELE